MDDHILIRYVIGACSDTERHRVETWAARDPVNRAHLRELQELWHAADPASRDWDVDEAWSKVAPRLSCVTDQKYTTPQSVPGSADVPSTVQDERPERGTSAGWRTRSRGAALRYGLSVAAIVAAVVVAHVLRRPAPDPNESSTQTITTERAEQAQIRLADGTRVHLNAESQIQYPGRFSKDQRTVRLTGEAYFEVEADTVRPFVVTTETATLRVLGTAFMVDAYADSARTHVAVRHGRVTLAPDRSASSAAERAAKTVEELVISAGQWGVVDLSGQMLRRRSADVAHHFGWLNNQLVFRAAPLRSVARRLERWYDVEVRIVSSRLAERRLTATFSDEPLDEVLHALALSLNARYQRDGRTVTFHSASSSSRLPKP